FPLKITINKDLTG
ncbi:hypothetical protein MK338_07335, partial [Streptococcus vestibularis]|nr:hypothetical protein [Streptococcus vestibularis]